ncbi:serine/arginine repetitive matrix protein 1-like isoform X1 [Macrobrachium nipponense]|uniref:serine/arginine repetitive matrix protein 1-like isoform X1 n=1 Tax=Macrobrachium nipponense TaxID=159736 RepID=UPI0030C8C537
MATTSNPSSCATSSTGSYGIPIPDSADSSKRSLSDAGRQRLSSFPSRQRRMGPAPLASFEDLSMDKTTSDSSPEERNNTLPDIGEETSTATTPITPVAKTELSVPASPRIRVSAASSSSPHETDSKESTPEKDLISGYAKSAYFEDMAADLHSSTEELDADEEEKNRKRRERACKLAEIERREEALRVSELNRKGSSSSVISDGLLPVTSGHSSRLSSLGSIGSPRRSPSPHRMLLETSFCGNRPIQQPSIDLEDPPVTTTKIMNFTIDKIERVKSPMEAKPPDIFRSSPATLPRVKQDGMSFVGVSTVEAEILPVKTHTIGVISDTRLPRDKEALHTRKEKHAEVKELPITTAISPSFTEQQSTHPPKSPRQNESEQQHRQPLSSQSSPRSPRMPKKVPVPQVPDLKDLPKASPSPTTTTPDHHGARTTSTTPSASPRASRRRRTRDEVESASSSPSVSRKSSFTNLFRKSDNLMSPVTPDSPGSSGRKSPFSQFIKSAKKEFRSRSRSRSRSKSRERDLDDDTHDRRSVLSIFKPKSKKQKDSEKSKGSEKGSTSSETKVNEAITNVEFTFNDDGKYQSSTFGLIRQESELNRAIKEPLRGTRTPGSESETQQQQTESMIQSRDSSYNELSSIMNSAESKKEKIPADESKIIADNEKRQTLEDDVFDKPSQSPVPQSVQPEKKEREPDVDKIDKPTLPPKQKERTSDADAVSELSALDPNADADSRSESERDSEIDYLKTKEKIQQKGPGAIESPEIENKGLVSQDSAEEGELPYVPTSLPFERPLAAPMVPVKERHPEMRHTQSIDRPRSTTPMTPGRLEEYKQVAPTPDSDSDKMMINIPQTGPVKVLPTKSPKRQASKSWEDFCQEGLRSPRQLRKQYRENSLKSQDDDDKPPPLPPKSRSPARSPVAPPPAPPTPPAQTGVQEPVVKSWINFDELPDVVLKPVRQIKTAPTRHQSQHRSQEQRRPQSDQDSRFVQEEQKLQKEIVHLHEGPPVRKHPPPLSATINHDAAQDSDGGQAHSEVSTPDKADSFDHSSDSDKPTSPSSSEDLTTVREKLEEIKKEGKTGDDYENSDLERLLAPVNDCINRLSSLSSEPGMLERKSPIPDNWADFLLPPQPGRRSRLSSLGSETGSIAGGTGRSPSPSCMLLETSFCGSAPIDDPAAAEPDVPIAVARKLSGISLGDFSTFTTRDPLHSPNHLPCPDRTSILSDSSAEGGSPREADYYSRHHHESHRGHSGHQQLNPFGMDLGVRSNRSSVVSQDQSPPESPNFASYHHSH